MSRGRHPNELTRENLELVGPLVDVKEGAA